MSDSKPGSYFYGMGRRKEATATVHLLAGKGLILVNSKTAEEYFGSPGLIDRVRQPLVAVSKDKDFDIQLRVSGGGKAGQADASRLAVAKAIVTMSEELRPTLKKAGLMKRDSRVKERKKYGLKRARKAPQFTKR